MSFFGYLKKDRLVRESFILVILLMIFFTVVLMSFATNYYSLYYENEQNIIGASVMPEMKKSVNVTKQLSLFIEQSETVSRDEFINFCDGVCTLPGVTKALYSESGVVSHVYPTTYEADLIGTDIISTFDFNNLTKLNDAIELHELFITYNSDQTEMLVHKPIMKNDVFVGLVTVYIDIPALQTLIPDSVEQEELVVMTSDEVYIFGNEDKLSDVKDMIPFNIDGADFTYGTMYHGDTYEDIMWLAGIGSVLVILALVIIFHIVYSNQKKTILFIDEIEYAKKYSVETGLRNKKTMHDDFNDLKEQKEKFYIVYGIFNNLKFINYKYGYELGQDVLLEAINLIQGVVRNTVEMYHLGGDEYAFIFSTDQSNEVKNILNRILRVFERDIVIKRIRTNISMSLGVIDYPRGGSTLDELIKNAHLTLSQSNILNTNGFVFYSHRQISDIIMSQDFDQYVSKLDLSLFDVYLMPIVDVNQDKIVGFECLTRAFNEFDELLDTGSVIASLERNGRIQELDEIVFGKMLNNMKEINQQFPKEELFLSVNASALSFNEQFVDSIIKMFKDSKLKSGTIVLELTESYKVEDHNYLIRLFKRLNSYGIRTAIDDFGSGYSSLSYISKFPIYSIKVDKAYVRDYYKNNFNRTLFLTLRGIAEVLDCRLVAEGVDDPETLDFLRENGCDWYQGFLYSKGIPFQQAIAMIRRQSEQTKE